MEEVFVSSETINPTTIPTPNNIDTGLACLVMLARFHSIAVDPHQIAHEFKETGKLFTTVEILLAAKKLGLITKKVKPQLSRLATTPMPAVVSAKDGSFLLLPVWMVIKF